MRRFILIFAACVVLEWLGAARVAHAQDPLGGCKLYQVDTPEGGRGERVTDPVIGLLSILTGASESPVRVDCDEMQFFADRIEIHHDKNLVTARGNVLFVTTGNRISAERMEFNTTSRTGTFYTASGTVTLGANVDKSLFGTQEPDATFYGERVDKLGPTKYRVTRGGFTSCVQPTPRWELVAGSVTLNLDDYALLKNAVFKVKGVPMLYLPIFYYPMEEDDRSTGFLIPTYGTSSYRGQTLSNAFFWAINRSNDAMFVHDWFSKTGQAYGGEYRYVASPSSDGTARLYMLREHSVVNADGVETSPARRSFELRGNARQMLPGKTRVAASADYSSDITSRQLYSQNLYDATSRMRNWRINSTTPFAGFTLNATYGRDEYFTFDNVSSAESSSVYGSRPRISLTRGSTQLGPIPAYVSGGLEYNDIQRDNINGETVVETGMRKMDAGAAIRVPFPKLPYFAINSTVGFRATRYEKSLDDDGRVVEVPIVRNYMDMRAELTGPTFVRIWDRPGSGYAARIKNIIEPSVEIKRTSKIDNYDNIVRLESNDYLVGGSLDTRYGITSRLLIKPGGEAAVSREIASFTFQQTHYSDPLSSQFDPSYSTSFRGRPPSNYSPMSFSAAFRPAPGSMVSTRLEYDPIADLYQTISIGGALTKGEHVLVNGNFSRQKLVTSVVDPFQQTANFLAGGTTLKTTRNTLGGSYSFNYDFARAMIITQNVVAYYNAQCCGVAVEYQVFNYGASSFVVPQDRRFNISFSLAGIGSFSNFLGAFGGQQNR